MTLRETPACTDADSKELWSKYCFFAARSCVNSINTYLAGMTSASNSATRCRRMMLLEGGIPRAVAIVSPVNEGSRTTSPPWTPLSTIKLRILYRVLQKGTERGLSGHQYKQMSLCGQFWNLEENFSFSTVKFKFQVSICGAHNENWLYRW